MVFRPQPQGRMGATPALHSTELLLEVVQRRHMGRQPTSNRDPRRNLLIRMAAAGEGYLLPTPPPLRHTAILQVCTAGLCGAGFWEGYMQ